MGAVQTVGSKPVFAALAGCRAVRFHFVGLVRQVIIAHLDAFAPFIERKGDAKDQKAENDQPKNFHRSLFPRHLRLLAFAGGRAECDQIAHVDLSPATRRFASGNAALFENKHDNGNQNDCAKDYYCAGGAVHIGCLADVCALKDSIKTRFSYQNLPEPKSETALCC